MGFPRILSKNNKIYTKLGDFCLSVDGNNFWILCHTCQQELQTQDQFWKHIQDEHNFLQSLKQEHKYVESGATLMPFYRKVNEEESSNLVEQDGSQPHAEHQQNKNFGDIRSIETNNVDLNIKVEPQLIQPSPVAPLGLGVTQSSLYQIAQGQTSSSYTGIVHTPSHPAINMSMVTPPSHELQKEANTNSVNAAFSEDGERWFICDYETCKLKFKYQSRLELHRVVHSKERRFACELCGASFKQSCNLSTHRKKKHFLKGSKSLLQHY